MKIRFLGAGVAAVMLVAAAGANAGQIGSVKNAGEQVTICRPIKSESSQLGKLDGQSHRGWMICEPLSRFERTLK